MQDYYVYFITAYDSENQEMGQYLRAVSLEVVLGHLDDREALDRARQMAPGKPQFVIKGVVHKCPELENQRPAPAMSPEQYVELTKNVPAATLNGRVLRALSEPMEQ